MRDALRERFGVRAVEMEASGIADGTWLAGDGYLVVRGTCDYCDHSKNDRWQKYASLIAAAYTRALVEAMELREMDAAAGMRVRPQRRAASGTVQRAEQPRPSDEAGVPRSRAAVLCVEVLDGKNIFPRLGTREADLCVGEFRRRVARLAVDGGGRVQASQSYGILGWWLHGAGCDAGQQVRRLLPRLTAEVEEWVSDDQTQEMLGCAGVPGRLRVIGAATFGDVTHASFGTVESVMGRCAGLAGMLLNDQLSIWRNSALQCRYVLDERFVMHAGFPPGWIAERRHQLTDTDQRFLGAMWTPFVWVHD